MPSVFVWLLTEGLRFIESWDFEVSPSSFLQFDLNMGCSKTVTPTHGVHLQFSTDCGHHWTLVTPECIPPAIGCATYTQSSIYSTPQYSQWRRVTVYLPTAAKYAIYTFHMHFLFWFLYKYWREYKTNNFIRYKLWKLFKDCIPLPD